ncbi:MAG: hypothetical protein HWE39_00860 [Oceanospirillaceae bacterium]|nr:hypothetical protein [Oceanospirillaceae bacterium]
MRIAVVGGVASTETLIRSLICHGFEKIKVWGYEPEEITYVSGWRDLRHLSEVQELPFEGFRHVTECEESLRAFGPDILFVVGLSQIIPNSMMNIAARVNVGFHPTALPHGRGRAALAWLILQEKNGAATFFELREGVDDGPIFVQEPFVISDEDDAAEVECKLLAAEKRALERWLPRLVEGQLSSVEQDHTQATWLGRRTPEDGWLNWQASRIDLIKLVRASAPPHPGAFTFCQDHKILVLKAMPKERAEIGVPGRILRVYADESFDVQTGDGILKITKWLSNSGWTPRVGALLGYYTESEVFELRRRLDKIEKALRDLYAQEMGTSS